MNALSNHQPHWPECHVVVLGGGPAGAAAAITLARAGRSVVVIEKSLYDRERIGETLPPAARRSLLNLSVWEQFVAAGHLPSPGVLSVWGDEELYQNHFIFNPYGQGWHLDRRRFDAMLAEVAHRAGASLFCGAHIVSCLPVAVDGWQVEFTSGGQRHQLRATFMIDATGRPAALARQQGAKRINGDRLIGLAGLLTARSPESGCDACTLVEASPDGWWYSALLPDARLIAVYMTDADLLPTRPQSRFAFWQTQLEQTIHTRARRRGFDHQASLRVVAASSSRLDRVTGRNWLAAGDAALAFDPLSSQGMRQALASGISAGEALHRCLSGEAAALGEYGSGTQRVFAEYARQHSVYYGRERRWPQSVFWERRQTALAS